MPDNVQSTPIRKDSSLLTRQEFSNAFTPYHPAAEHTRDQIIRGASLIVMSAGQYLKLTGLTPLVTEVTAQRFTELPWLQVEPKSGPHWRVNLCGNEQSARMIATHDPEWPLPVLILHEENSFEGYHSIEGLGHQHYLRQQIGEPLSPQRLHAWLA